MTKAVIGILVLVFAAAGDAAPGLAPAGPFDGLPPARVITDSAQRQMIIELPPVDLPARSAGTEMAMVLLPVYSAQVGVGGSLVGAQVELVDAFGNEVPRALLHHFNLTDPTRRELFLPTSLHMLAASKETPPMSVPRFVFGVPVHRGQRLLASAMLGNESDVAYRQIRVRAVLHYEPENEVWPLFPAYPWVMDVLFPSATRRTGARLSTCRRATRSGRTKAARPCRGRSSPLAVTCTTTA